MCNFIDDIPTKSKTSEIAGKTNKFLEVYLKPTPDDQIYRFRLIGISTKTRDNPFIEKYIHEVWKFDEDGHRTLADSIVCPKTKYVGKAECPVCKHTDQLWITCKNSGWTDKISQKKRRDLLRQYRAHLLVYVVNDPNYNGNNGKLKVITFKDPEDFKTFYNKAKEVRRNGIKIFNGGAAVDLWIRVGKVEETWYEGTPREVKREVTKITDMGFSTKPYPLPVITPALVDGFPFDSEFFEASTESEVLRFYNKYCTGVGVEIPADDIVPTVKTSTKSNNSATTVKATTNSISQKKMQETVEAAKEEVDNISIDDIEDFIDSTDDIDVDDTITNSAESTKDNNIDDDNINIDMIDMLLKDIG